MNTEEMLNRAQLIAPDMVPYLQGDTRSDLLVPRCIACGSLQWPPRPSCSKCGEDVFEPEPVEPIGELYSWTTTHRAPSPEFSSLVPYTVVIIELETTDRVRLLGRLAETNASPTLRVGMRMRGEREHRDGLQLLVWRIDE